MALPEKTQLQLQSGFTGRRVRVTKNLLNKDRDGVTNSSSIVCRS